MKQPNLIQRLKAAIFPNVGILERNIQNALIQLNQGITIYPYGDDLTFIEKGYQKNWAVYVVVHKIVKKFGQVPFYHYKIKTSERKAYFEEYIPLTKNSLHDIKARLEMRKILTKSVDQVAVTSPLSQFLNKPNRNQTGSRFRGNLMGHKLLTGEGNTWLSRPKDENGNPDMRQKPSEMFVIPKANLALVKGSDPWAIAKYKLIISGGEVEQDKDNIMMWIEDTYGLDPITLRHLRGQAPLDAWLLGMQATNEGVERMASMNKNQGVSGFAWNKADSRAWTVEQAMFNRRQFNSIVNDKDLAGTIAYFSGDWGFQQIGLDARALQLLEQQDKALDITCMIFDIPVGMFRHGTTYENKPAEKKDFIYDCIAPAAYELRDQWNEKLIPQFNLDRERDVIDCDILSLPDLAEDLKTQVDTLKSAWWLTPNEIRDQTGFDRMTDPNMDKIYASGNIQPLDQLNVDPGGNLDAQLNLLNQ